MERPPKGCGRGGGGGGGGGAPGYSGFKWQRWWQGWSNEGKIKNWKKIRSASNKTQKIPGPKKFNPKSIPWPIPSHKIFPVKNPKKVRTCKNLQVMGSWYLPKFSYPPAPPKNPEIENFKPQKILRSSLSLEIRSEPPPPWGPSSLILSRSGRSHAMLPADRPRGDASPRGTGLRRDYSPSFGSESWINVPGANSSTYNVV